MGCKLEFSSVDRRIWEEELCEFVPGRIFDIHTHVYRWRFNTDPEKSSVSWQSIGEQFPEAGKEELDEADGILLPGREVHRLSFGMPFSPSCAFGGSNEFTAEQVGKDALSAGLMLVEPGMGAEYVEEQVERLGLVGFKPYRMFSVTGDAVECRIGDFLPEHQIRVADRRGLIVMLHLSKRDCIADGENIEDLKRFSSEYPGVKWVLAHCGRSYSAWAIEAAAKELGGLGNLWYETSSVCESDAFDALFSGVGIERVMYGSDNMPVGVLRGKYISFGYGWAYLGEDNHSLELSHCDGRMTFTLYEQLRGMRRAAERLGITAGQREDLFFNTAAKLVGSAGQGTARAG